MDRDMGKQTFVIVGAGLAGAKAAEELRSAGDGRVLLIGCAMLGEPVRYDRIPYCFSDQFNVGMEHSGYAPAWDEVVFRGDVESGEFIAFSMREGYVAAGMSVNVWDVNEDVQVLIRSRVPVERAALSDRDTPLDSLVGKPPTSAA
jgi:Reductase C-terminal